MFIKSVTFVIFFDTCILFPPIAWLSGKDVRKMD